MHADEPRRELTVQFGPDHYLRLETNSGGHSTLSSVGLRCDPGDPYAAEYNAGIDGIEHILLALWAVGVEVSEQQLESALETATLALADQYPS